MSSRASAQLAAIAVLSSLALLGCGEDEPERGTNPADLGAVGAALPGEFGVTLGSPQDALTEAGELTADVAWSTIKVPIALRVLEDAGGPSRLSGELRALIEQAITVSDNKAADQLFADLAARHGGTAGAAEAVTEVLREAGDRVTRVSTAGRGAASPYGQTIWSLREQARFMSALAGGCVASAGSRRYVLDLMGRVTDRWGFGATGAPARWKGGWGPDPNGHYLVRQMGLIEVRGRPVVVTLAVAPDDGSFETGQALATELAQGLISAARNSVRDPATC
jgi:Beta-lactamase enzyme family